MKCRPADGATTLCQPGPELDVSQQAAATWEGGPLLVDAGPGTGKTRTLVRRIEHLLGRGSMSLSGQSDVVSAFSGHAI